MEKWVEDIKMAIELADKCNGPSAEILSSSFTDNSKSQTLFCMLITASTDFADLVQAT